ARVGERPDGVVRRAHRDPIARDRDRGAELVPRAAVGSAELLLQVPDRAALTEDVRRALIRPRRAIVTGAPDDRGRAAHAYRGAEEVKHANVRGEERLLQ